MTHETKLLPAALALLVVPALLAGCATSRSEVKLETPKPVVAEAQVSTAEPKAPAASKGIVFLRSVTDDRVFEEKPSDPSHPSLGFGGASAASADVKARAIGRKRGGFGQAMGDVLLQNGQTVTGVIGDDVAAAFRNAGYQVVTTEAGSAASAHVVDVHIKQFWTWFKPGFWAVTLTSTVTTEFQFEGATSPTTVTAQAAVAHQLVTDSDWISIADSVLADYRTKVTALAADLH